MSKDDSFISHTRIVFESNTLGVYSHYSSSSISNCLEFYVVHKNGGGNYLGGDIKYHLQEQLKRIKFTQPSSVKATDFCGEMIVDVINYTDLSHIGYLVFSGYNTINFLKDLQGINYVVFADSNMKVFTQAQLIDEQLKSFESSLLSVSFD